MANGSFGLSGFPTAPTTTSTGGGTNNALTPVTVAVNSVAGFSSGSLVYNRAGDYANPVSTTGTATFPINATPALYNSSSTPSWTSTAATGTGDCTVVNNKGIAMGWQHSCTLTSGNIALTYNTAAGGVNFKIIDESYATVVADTATTLVSGSNRMGALALTGGGFVIYCANGANNLTFAIYSNTGTLVTAPITDATYVFNGMLRTVARPDGSFIVYGVETGTTSFVYKVYSAVGVQVYAWTVLAVTSGTPLMCTISVRSDNSFVLCYNAVTTGYLTYAVRSATNTVTVAPTTFGGNTTSSNSCIDSVCLSTNDVVFTFVSSTSAVSIRTLSSANALGAVVTVLASSSGVYFPNALNIITAYLLASDQILIGGYNLQTGDHIYKVMAIVINSSGTILSGSTPIVFHNTCTPLHGSYPWPLFVKTTNYIHNINWNSFGSITQTTGRNSCPLTTVATRISPTTYLVVPNQSTAQQVGSTAVQAVTTYAPGNSSVVGAAYYAATSGAVSTTIAAPASGTAFTGVSIDSSFTVQFMDSCSLAGGGVAILYANGSTGVVKVAIYNIAMVLQTTITITDGSTAYGAQTPAYAVTQLSNGKLLVAYVNTSNVNVVCNIYSTSYLLLNTVTITGGTSAANIYYSIGVAALTGGRWAYTGVNNASNYVRVGVYSDTGAVLVALADVVSASANNPQIAANASGFTVSLYAVGIASLSIYNYYETVDQSNSFTKVGTAGAVGGITGNYYACKGVSTSEGNSAFAIPNGTATARPMRVMGGSNPSLFTNGTSLNVGANFNTPTCYAGIGAVPSGGTMFLAYYPASNTGLWVYESFYNDSGISTNTFSFSGGATNAGCTTATGLYGTTMVITYANSLGNPAYALVNVMGVNYTTNLVAGSTASNASQTLAPSTGYYLLGVAASDCPANGSGNVTINGSATLNSAYPATATAQSFDFSSPVTFGAKGTQLNRNVNLQGNV